MRIIVDQPRNLARFSPAKRPRSSEELRPLRDEIVVGGEALTVRFGANEHGERRGEVVPAGMVSWLSTACR
jgi:hypothetical protein